MEFGELGQYADEKAIVPTRLFQIATHKTPDRLKPCQAGFSTSFRSKDKSSAQCPFHFAPRGVCHYHTERRNFSYAIALIGGRQDLPYRIIP